MTTDTEPASARPPAPDGVPVSRSRMLISLLGAPAAWLIQMTVSEPLAAHACYPRQVPLSAPLWGALPWMLAIVSLVCLAAAVASGIVAWTTWRHIRRMAPDKSRFTAESGEGHGQFLPLLGVIGSLLFVIAIVFTGCAIVLVAPCSSWF